MESMIEKSIAFHGHFCPGLAVGIRMCREVADRFQGQIFPAKDEEFVCVTESEACFVDAIQCLLGCTLGKANLILDQKGKFAASFYSRSLQKGIRILWTAPSEQEYPPWKDRAVKREDFLHGDRCGPWGELYRIEEIPYREPPHARVVQSYVCAGCGEKTADFGGAFVNSEFFCTDCLNRSRS